MQAKYILLFVILISIPGCTLTGNQNLTPTLSPPLPTPSPSITFTPSAIPTITPSPGPTLTPTFPPYTHEPFSIVFFRDWNLWIADIGESTVERQLTFEPPEMHVTRYAISPDGTRIVYIPYQVETLNSLIKLVHISTGETDVVLGENDPYNEINVFWLDNTKIAYVNQGLVPAFTTEKVKEITTYIIYDLASKKQIAITEHKSISQSPNGRYWLTCAGSIVCKYTLHDLINGTQYKIGGNVKWGGFISWSPDSKFMLFHSIDSEGGDCTSQIILINTETLQEKIITPEDKDAWEARISPSNEFLVYKQTDITDFNTCKHGSHNYWLMNMTDYKIQMIPVSFDKETTWGVQWTPDGKRLVFFYTGYRGYDLWSMNLDGSDLEPILANVMDYRDYEIIATNK